MTKQEMRDLATVGAAAKLREIETMLVDFHKVFPQVFLSATPPQLVRPELHNGHSKWPTVVAHTNGTGPTTKVHTEKSKRHDGVYSRKVMKNRRRSAAILAFVKQHQPITKEQFLTDTTWNPRLLAPLIRRQYLKRSALGYKVTDKVFSVKKD